MLRAALTMKYLFDHYDFTSSGAISALVQGLLAKELWKRGLPVRVAGVPHPHSACPRPSRCLTQPAYWVLQSRLARIHACSSR